MSSTRKLWIYLAILLGASFSVLLWTGSEIYRAAPPMPQRVIAADGQTIYTREEIETGRQVWQSMGGMQLGSIWGHGGYVAPDWSADWLHREAIDVLDQWAQREAGVASYALLDDERKAALQGRLESRIRTNTYDPASGT
jgi:nitric oxide reductase subunit B